MSFTHRTRMVNPRLGSYFGIFMSALTGIAMVTLILENLGIRPDLLSLGMLAGPILMYCAIGIAGYATEPVEFFASGRRVPAFYNGLALSTSAFGACGFMALTGAFFLIGFDALCLAIGAISGFVVMSVMIAPFLRKFGAYTIPSYLGRRFDSRALRLMSAVLLSVPILLLLTAELRMGAYAAAWLSGRSTTEMTLLLTGVLALTLTAGGMRSLTWSSVAQGIAALAAFVIPVSIVAILVTNLPLPQLSHGPVLRMIGRNEAIQGLPIILPPLLAFDIPAEGLNDITKRFSDAFGNVGSLAFVIVTLTTLAGIASAPWLLPRVSTAPGVYEARKSLGWATVLFGIAILTSASIAVFMRDVVTDAVAAPASQVLPAWVNELASRGSITLAPVTTKLQFANFSFVRDAIVFSLPVALGLPEMLLNVAILGAVAAALAATGAAAVALGNIVAEDIINGLSWEPLPTPLRLNIARATIMFSAALGASLAIVAPTDPLRLLLWALALTASSCFPVLVLSIWWKRINAVGAMAGIVSGFSVASLAVIAGEAQWIEFDSALAAAFGMPIALLATIAATLATPPPSKHLLEFVRDIRVPGGEILYDREMRLLRTRKQRQRS